LIWGILGETGDGKTIYQAHIGYNSYLAGTIIHANFKLNFPYEHIYNIEDLKELPLSGKRLFLLDELWITGDSFESQNKIVRLLSSFILQCRKKNADCIHTNQTEMQLVSRIRNNTSLFLKPRITLSYDENNKIFTHETPHPDKGIVPYIINVRWYDKYLNYLNYDEPFAVYPAHLYYNTHEEMKPLPSLNTDKLLIKYEDFNGSRAELSAVLEKLESMSHREALSFSNFIHAIKENPNLRSLIVKKNEKKQKVQ
jgi:hypothetical protein